jgi:hypothetical protein
MPAAGAFKETSVEPAITPPPFAKPVATAATPAANKRVARVTPAPPEITPLPRVELADPLAPLRPRRRVGEDAADSAFTLPEARRFGSYEDDNGPPINLPP